MYNGNLISLKKILWRVFNNPYAEDLNHEDAAEYAIEAIKLIGAPLSFLDKVTYPPLKIVNYKAALPCNIINLRGVKLLDANGRGEVALTRATDIYHQSIRSNDSGPTSNVEDDGSSPYDVINVGVNSGVTQAGAPSGGVDGQLTEYTYTAQNGVIQTSFKEGDIEVSYKSLATDDEGYPLIPDNQEVKLALEYYILFRFLEPLWIMGKVTDKAFQYVDQKKCWYLPSANTSMQLQSGDHLESVMNSINRLIVNDTAFENSYKGTGKRERIKKYH